VLVDRDDIDVFLCVFEDVWLDCPEMLSPCPALGDARDEGAVTALGDARDEGAVTALGDARDEGAVTALGTEAS